MRCAGFLGSGDLGYGAVTLDPAERRGGRERNRASSGWVVEEAAEAIIRSPCPACSWRSRSCSRGMAPTRAFRAAAVRRRRTDDGVPAGARSRAAIASSCRRRRACSRRLADWWPISAMISSARRSSISRRRARKILDGHAELGAAGASAGSRRSRNSRAKHTSSYSADMRYRGQSYEIEVPLEAAWIETGDLRAVASAFHAEHERVYEHADAKAPVQIINLRLVASGDRRSPKYARAELVSRGPSPAAETRVFYDGAHVGAGRLRSRQALAAGAYVCRAGDRSAERLHDMSRRRLPRPRSTHSPISSSRATRAAHEHRHESPWRSSKNHARAAAESMAFTLYRTAHATFVKETEDFTTGLATPGRDLRHADRARRHLVRRPQLWTASSAPSPATRRATSASPTTPIRGSCARTRPTSTSGSRSSTTGASSASRSGISITPTWAAPCRRRCRAR